ncbi:MAG: 30S ribosomal protein S11 [Candidatus Marinimicrobia bacterium]|nr:30S ribosomal protein S11 [Candidatus Neomarinimicrobiota bacterium]
MAKAQAKSRKKRKLKVEPEGIVHIMASFNNTIISISDRNGNVISWASAGTAGAKGSRKNTPYAASLAAEKVGKEAMDLGLQRAEIRVKGPGGGRESAIRSIAALGLEITAIKDITPIPHNGCRPSKKRRV